MAEIGYGRLRDLGGLPDLLRSLAGEEGLNRAFHDQDLPVALLATPDATVPMRDIMALYHRAAEITSMRSFGLQASTDIDAGQHGPVGQYITQARDLPHALERLRAALPYHESGSSLEIEARANELRVGYRNVHQDLVGWRHAGDFVLCIMADLISGYLGEAWKPLRIETCCPKGPWEYDHEDHFGVPVLYGQDQMAIVLDRDSIQRNSEARNSEARNSEARNSEARDVEPGRMVSLGDLRRLGERLPRDFPQVVANIVDRRLLDGASDLDGTAASLGLGPRTLQRRLGDLGLSYRDLALRCRMRRARELLAEPDTSVRQVGRQAGYASTPQFTRAFKACFGTTPTEFRKSVT